LKDDNTIRKSVSKLVRLVRMLQKLKNGKNRDDFAFVLMGLNVQNCSLYTS